MIGPQLIKNLDDDIWRKIKTNQLMAVWKIVIQILLESKIWIPILQTAISRLFFFLQIYHHKWWWLLCTRDISSSKWKISFDFQKQFWKSKLIFFCCLSCSLLSVVVNFWCTCLSTTCLWHVQLSRSKQPISLLGLLIVLSMISRANDWRVIGAGHIQY